ncbi:MAG: hypothetical protein ACLR6W_01075 [Evtepia sp.]
MAVLQKRAPVLGQQGKALGVLARLVQGEELGDQPLPQLASCSLQQSLGFCRGMALTS